jgi:transposase
MILRAREVRLTPEDRAALETRCRAATTPQRDVWRARIVLLAADGASTRSIARTVGVEEAVVSTWRHRFADQGLEGLQERKRSGKPRSYTAETDKRILKVLDEAPPKGYARWTAPLISERLGDVHEQYIWRVLGRNQIDLAGRKSWCESNDPEFVAKAADVVGLYIAPPENAIVICVDEKPSIQALERAQGYLKLPNGRAKP